MPWGETLPMDAAEAEACELETVDESTASGMSLGRLAMMPYRFR
jgi:hypothetical protein